MNVHASAPTLSTLGSIVIVPAAPVAGEEVDASCVEAAAASAANPRNTHGLPGGPFHMLPLLLLLLLGSATLCGEVGMLRRSSPSVASTASLHVALVESEAEPEVATQGREEASLRSMISL